jgi:hypothetical protein
MNSFNGTRQKVVHLGQEKTVAQLATESGLPVWTVYARYRRGDRDAKLVRPQHPRRKRVLPTQPPPQQGEREC